MTTEHISPARRWGAGMSFGAPLPLLVLIAAFGAPAALFALQRFTLLGTLLIVSGIGASLGAALCYILVIRGSSRAALSYGRLGVRAALIAALLTIGLLAYLFAAQRYEIRYVYDYSASDLPLRYRVAALWAGQPGSFAIWALWGLFAAQILVRCARHAEAYILSVFMPLQAALLLFMLILNPFVPYRASTGLALAPADGHGLNPLLQNPWMVIHPPVLFLGYTLLAVVFASAVGGLWRRDYDGWARAALPWALAGWAVLGAALLLGGYWAYETLGWGGYWGWDPVENSALVAWLAATALIHALLVQRAGGGLRRMALTLAVVTYALVFYATYLTRSGVLSNFSVHTFAQEAIMPTLTVALALLAGGGGAALAWRWRDIPSRPLSDKLFARDSFVVLGILALLVIAAVIGVGTSMPLISAIPGLGSALREAFGAVFDLDQGTRFTQGLRSFADARFSLVASFYTATVPPLGVVLALLLTIGPLLGWRDVNPRHLLRALRWPFVGAVATTCGALLLGARDALPLAYLSLGSLAAGTNLVMIARLLKSGWLRIGGYLAHVGMALLVAGIIGSTVYAAPEQKIVIPESESINAYGYDFTFDGWRATPDNIGVLDLTISRGADVFQAAPQFYFHQREGATMKTPAIKRELLRDVYIEPVDYQAPLDRNAPELGFNDTQEIGPYTITFLGLDAAELSGRADVGVKLRVRYQDQEIALAPRFPLGPGAPNPPRAPLPGGRTLWVEAVDLTRRMARIRVDGLNLPVEPGLAVLNVSLKPGITLVWLGVIVSALGGLIAMLRRAREGQARGHGEWAHAPPRLGGPAEGALRRGALRIHDARRSREDRSYSCGTIVSDAARVGLAPQKEQQQ